MENQDVTPTEETPVEPETKNEVKSEPETKESQSVEETPSEDSSTLQSSADVAADMVDSYYQQPRPQTQQPQQQAQLSPAQSQQVQAQAQNPTEMNQYLQELSQLPQDEYGNVDSSAFMQWLSKRDQSVVETAKQTARQEIAEQTAFNRAEEAQWRQAVKQYPQLEQDADIRNMVHNARLGELAQGKNPTVADIANRLFSKIGNAKKEGAEQAQTNTHIQESAHLESSDTSASDSASKKQDLFNRMSSRDNREAEAARKDYLRSLIDSGDIEIRQ